MPFNKPGEAPKDRLSEHLDKPILLRPFEYKVIETQFGDSTVLMADVLVITPERGSAKFYNLGPTPIFWKGVQHQLEESMGEWCLGRLHQGTTGNPKQYVLLDPTQEDEEAAEAVITTHEGAF